jgi:DNA replication protein DnaC
LSRIKVSTSDNRCPSCNRYLQVENGKEFCFYCDKIAAEDERLKHEAEQMINDRELRRAQEIFNNESLVNDRLKGATFANYQTDNRDLQRAKAICQRYAENFSKDNPVDLLLIGSYGTGKSHLAYSISKKVVEKKMSSIFISVPKLLTKIKSTYNPNSQHVEIDLLNIIEKVDCLVLDDIGSEQTKIPKNGEVPWNVVKLFEIIDSRAGKHTIYTTNYEIDELQKALGGRNFSRMMDGVHPVKMYGEDYRLKDFRKQED